MSVLFKYLVLSILVCPALLSQSPTPSDLKVSDPAPDFTLPYATMDSIPETDITLSALVGSHPIVLAFYPADWSGGCTREVCTFRDDFTALSGLSAEIIGISGDYTFSHHEWAKFQKLPFKLASDHDHAVAKRYNSYNVGSGYNKRTVFVIDQAGRVAYIDLAYSTKDLTSFNHLKDALKTLQ